MTGVNYVAIMVANKFALTISSVLNLRTSKLKYCLPVLFFWALALMPQKASAGTCFDLVCLASSPPSAQLSVTHSYDGGALTYNLSWEAVTPSTTDAIVN